MNTQLHDPSLVCKPPRVGLWTSKKKLLGFGSGGIALAGIVALALGSKTPAPSSTAPTMTSVAAHHRPPTTFAELCALTPEALEKCDLARINLLCAEGLPGSESMNLTQDLKTLDFWTECVRGQIEKNLHHFVEAPEKYRHSEAYFRMAMMVTVLKQDLKVHYDEARSNDEPNATFFADASCSHLNGLLGPRHAGTCASIPVLIVAVSQRLGYPVKLVTARAHFFARWENDRERLNIEASNNGGMVAHPDEYYRTWPKPDRKSVV